MANSWGASTGLTGKTTNNSTTQTELLSDVGNIAAIRTHGGKQEVTEESYFDNAGGDFTNLAVNQQENNTGVVTAHNLIESNTDWNRQSKTTLTPAAKTVIPES